MLTQRFSYPTVFLLGALALTANAGCGDDDDQGGGPRAGSSGAAGRGGSPTSGTGGGPTSGTGGGPSAGAGGAGGGAGEAGAGGAAGAGQAGAGGAAGVGQAGAGGEAGAGQAGAGGGAGAGQAGAGGEAGRGGGVSGAAGGGAAGAGGISGAAGGGVAGTGGAGGAAGAAGGGGGTSDLLDPTFGTGGVFVVPTSEPSAYIGLSLGSEGRTNLFFATEQTVAVGLLDDGSLDPGFGSGGMVLIPDGGAPFQVSSIVTQPDGKIVAGGTELSSTTHQRPALSRLNADGTPDTSFGKAAYSLIDIEGRDTSMVGLGLHQGRPIMVGMGIKVDERDFFVQAATLRARTDGSLDPTFHAPDGLALYPPVPDVNASLEAIDVTGDGLTYACGHIRIESSYDLLALRYLPDGVLDPTFGQGGAVHVDLSAPVGGPEAPNDFARTCAATPDGKLVVGAETSNQIVLTRLLHDGTLDTGFGQGGFFSIDLGEVERLGNLVVLPDGSIVVAASNSKLGSWSGRALLFGVRPDGTLATEFGNNGSFTFGPAGLYAGKTLVGRRPDGKLVVVSALGPPVFVARLKAP